MEWSRLWDRGDLSVRYRKGMELDDIYLNACV
jgi:hypothetical protein